MNDPKPLRDGLDQYELIGSQPFAIGRASACFRALNSQQTIVCIKQFSPSRPATAIPSLTSLPTLGIVSWLTDF